MASVNISFDSSNERKSRGFTYRDIDFKFILNEGKRDFKTFNDIESVRNGLRNIFSWRQGERIIIPEFGNVLIRYIYEPMTALTVANIQRDLKEMVERWEPRVKIDAINAVPFPDANELLLTVVYRIPTLSNKVINFSTLLNEESVK
jgi:phage baseplate assembly protein W